MSRLAYVNGQYVPHRSASVHIEDRGYQFADGVYEVIAVQNNALVDEQGHMERLGRSLKELSIVWPMSPNAMQVVMREVIRRNRITHGMLYLQITRGQARRDHAFPTGVQPSVVMTAKPLPPFNYEKSSKGVSVITIPDIRWKRRDIKSVSLLPNVMGKQQAVEAGAFEAWMVDDDGNITEGTSSNAWIVTHDGKLVTRDASISILKGITRDSVIAIANAQGLLLEERAFTPQEAKTAAEAFTTSTTAFVKPVVKIDDIILGDGKPGPLSLRLLKAYGAYLISGQFA